MLLNDKSITRSLFHPRGEEHGYSPQGIPTQTRCDGAIIGGYLHESHASDTLLLFFHGNGEIAADYDSLSSLFTNCGVTFWVVDYRGYGRSTGTPTVPHMLQDAEAVLHDIPRLAKNLNRVFRNIIVMGRSLGSASAIQLAAQHGPLLNGLILDSPYADGLALIQRLGGPLVRKQDIPEFQDNLDNMRQCRLRTLIIHGTLDRIIPVTDAEALYAACNTTNKQLVRIPGAGHNNLLMVGPDAYCRSLQEFTAKAH